MIRVELSCGHFAFVSAATAPDHQPGAQVPCFRCSDLVAVTPTDCAHTRDYRMSYGDGTSECACGQTFGTDGKPTDPYDAYKEAPAMSDPTETVRRQMIEAGQPAADLAAHDEATWSTEELQRDFSVIGFAAPFVIVRRKSDGQKGTLEFTHSPRVYFDFQPT